MPISKDKLAQIIANSSETIRSMEDRAPQRNVSRGRVNEGMMAGGPRVEDYDKDADMWDRMYSAEYDDDNSGASYPSGDIRYSESAYENSGMPDNIKKSMMEHRIDVSALDSNSSVLNGLNITPKPLSGGRKQQVTEQASYQQPQYGGGSIDYGVIKAIVSECIREYFSGKNSLNENALKSIVLKGGTIGLVDNSGNVYKAKLEKVDKK
jgi:hypothetical protein